jgi:hypothetical protein
LGDGDAPGSAEANCCDCASGKRHPKY